MYLYKLYTYYKNLIVSMGIVRYLFDESVCYVCDK